MITPPKNPMPNGFNLDDFVPSISPEDAQAFGEALESADLSMAPHPHPGCKCCGGTGWYYINHGNQGFERILCDCIEE